jgi:hypothetical protein
MLHGGMAEPVKSARPSRPHPYVRVRGITSRRHATPTTIAMNTNGKDGLKPPTPPSQPKTPRAVNLINIAVMANGPQLVGGLSHSFRRGLPI